MNDIPIPSEDDFKAMLDEAHVNNRLNGLPAKAPTELRRRMPDGTIANSIKETSHETSRRPIAHRAP